MNPEIDRNFVDEAIKHLQRDINCMIDQDRNLRKQGLTRVQEFLKLQDHEAERIFIMDGYILKNLIRSFEDQVDRNRELAILIVQAFIKHSNCNIETVKAIIDAILNRLNQLPFPETSEEIRLQLIKLLQEITNRYHQAYNDLLQRTAHMIGKSLQDNFADVKKETAIFAAELSKKLPIGDYMGDAVKALNTNMQHPHTKVRKATIESIAQIILSRVNGSFLEIVLQNLRNLSLDKSSDVRKGTFIAVAELLMHFSVANLNNYENSLLLILLNGLSDDNKDIQQISLNLLDQVGSKRQKLDEEV